MNILGISACYHDSAACFVRDGQIVAAAQEERFTRKKHDPDFPRQAAAYCLCTGWITAAVALDPSFAQASVNRGVAYGQTGRFDLALADYTAAIREDSAFFNACNNRGLALEDLGRFEDAVASYTRAIELQPGDAPSYTNRAIALDKLGRRERALRDYEAACRLGDEKGCAAARRQQRAAKGLR